MTAISPSCRGDVASKARSLWTVAEVDLAVREVIGQVSVKSVTRMNRPPVPGEGGAVELGGGNRDDCQQNVLLSGRAVDSDSGQRHTETWTKLMCVANRGEKGK